MDPELIATIGTILSFVAVAVFRDWRDGKSLFKKNGKHEVVDADALFDRVILRLDTNHFTHHTEAIVKAVEGVGSKVEKLNENVETFTKEDAEHHVRVEMNQDETLRILRK